MTNRPDYYRSPTGKLWTVMAYFNARKFALLPERDVAEGIVPPEVSKFNAVVALRVIQVGLSSSPGIQAEIDHVALFRIDKDEDGFPKLLLTLAKLTEMEKWQAPKRAPDLASKTHIYDIEGESAKLESLHGAFAVLRWCHELEGFPRREWTFPLYRWQLALAALGPVSFEMMSETHDATEDEI